MLKSSLYALALAVALVGSSVAGSPEEGLAAFQDANAAYKKGDYAQAVFWYRKAADQGHAMAQFDLANMYAQGRGVPQDFAQAVFWYRKAADHGHVSSQIALGQAYKDGRGVPQDYTQAVFWWRKAADYGDAVAQFSLGFMYVNGQGVPRDYIQAHMWWNLSASQTSVMRDFAVKRRDEVAAEMTASQIAEAQRLATAWKPKN